MNTNLLRGIQIGCVVMLAATQVLAKPNRTVVAGQSLGGVRLGSTRAQVVKILGKPTSSFSLKGGFTDDLWRDKNVSTDRNGNPLRHKVEVIYKAGKVVQVEATSPAFTTANGTSTRSALSSLTDKYPNFRVLVYGYVKGEGAWQNYYFDDVKKGISYEYEGWQEELYRRSMPSTIIIHKPGTRVLPDAGGKLMTDSTDLSVVMSKYDD